MKPAEADVGRFARAVEARLGLRIAERAPVLANVIARRSAHLGQTVPEYLLHVENANVAELRELATELTVGETYFFRHIEQYQAYGDLATELVATRGHVRVLSAGCSTGEEPYTLAIVAFERGLDARHVTLGALDANPAALARARRGRYTRWSLRATVPEHERRWFRTDGRELVLAPAVRELVDFREANLLEEHAIPMPPLWDVIFCRNVLMYFGDAALRRVVARLAAALAPGGYLFLGHAETLRDHALDFELCHTHGTFYYRRGNRPRAHATAAAATDSPPPMQRPSSGWMDDIVAASDRVRTIVEGALATPAPSAAPLDTIRGLIRDESFSEAHDALARLPPLVLATTEAHLLRAIVAMQTGDHETTRTTCETLLARTEYQACAHYLLSISEPDLGRSEEHARAASLCDPQFAMASVQLAFIARRRRDYVATRDHFARAIDLLEREDEDRLGLFGGGFSRSALIHLCRSEIA